jgi:hypothetical protein
VPPEAFQLSVDSFRDVSFKFKWNDQK